MLGFLFAAIAFAPPPVHGVYLEDALAFGVEKEAVCGLERLARIHPFVMRGEVVGWTTPEIFGEWQCECDWRWRCWYCLRIALDPEEAAKYCTENNCWPPSDEEIRRTQLECLDELRNLLGPENYYAGRMPPPDPGLP
jgi:hypothetical protein